MEGILPTNHLAERDLVTWRGRPEGGYQLFPEGRPGGGQEAGLA